MKTIVWNFCAVLMLALLAITGCMSMDDMLVSDDPFWRDLGESRAVSFAIDRYEANALQDKLDVVSKMRDQQKLAKIYVAKFAAPEVRKAARAKIAEESAFAVMLALSDDEAIQKEALDNIKTDNGRIAAARVMLGDRSKKAQVAALLGQVRDDKAVVNSLKDIAYETIAFVSEIKTKEYYSSSARDADVEKAVRVYSEYKALVDYAVDADAIAALATDEKIIATKGQKLDFATPLVNRVENARKELQAKAAAEFEAKERLFVSDPETFKKQYPNEVDKFAAELAKKREAEFGQVKNDVENMYVSGWNRGEHGALQRALDFARTCGDQGKIIELGSLVVNRLANFKKTCDESLTMSWSEGDKRQARDIITGWAGLPYEGMLEKIMGYISGNNMNGSDIILESVDPDLRSKLVSICDEAVVSVVLTSKSTAAVKDVEKISDKAALAKIAKEHSVNLVRAVAAWKQGREEYEKYLGSHAIPGPGNNSDIGGIFLGMDIGDAFAVLVKKCPEFAYYFEMPQSTDGVSRRDDIIACAKVEDVSLRVIFANRETGKVRKVMLPPQMVMKFFPELDTINEIGAAVEKALGLPMEDDCERAKIQDLYVAEQDVKKFASIDGSFASFAIAPKEVDSSAISLLSPDDEFSAAGFRAGAMYLICNQMGAPGTIILQGKKLTRKAATTAKDEDEWQARKKKLLEKWGPKGDPQK